MSQGTATSASQSGLSRSSVHQRDEFALERARPRTGGGLMCPFSVRVTTRSVIARGQLTKRSGQALIVAASSAAPFPIIELRAHTLRGFQKVLELGRYGDPEIFGRSVAARRRAQIAFLPRTPALSASQAS